MKNNDFMGAGIAAIALAVLFPLYWVYIISTGTFDSGVNYYQTTLEFGFDDVWLILLGALSIFVYWSLKKVLDNHLGYGAIGVPIIIAIVACGVYTFGLAGLDAFMSIFSNQVGLSTHKFVFGAQYLIGVVFMIVFGVADILIGVLILKNADHDSAVLKVLAIAMIIQGILELTVFLSPLVIGVFPITLIIMSVIFLTKPQAIEVV